MNPMTPLAPSASPTPITVRSRRTGLLVGGAVVLACGILAAALLWFAAGRRNDDAIRGLARAPIGCDTTLSFTETGRYLIFVETSGSLGDIDGTCPESGRFSTTDDRPDLQVRFVDDDGVDVGINLPRSTGVSYDGAGAEGQSIRSFEIESAGDYTLRVQSPDEGVAVAVGRDPSDGVGLLQNLAALSALAGLIGGGILLVVGARRHDMTLAPESPQWPGASPPTSPPGMGVPAPPPGWQPAAGPPTTLRPPGQSAGTPPTWAAPMPASMPQHPVPWTQPDQVSETLPTSPAQDPSSWAPQPRQQPGPPSRRDEAVDNNDSGWAPPSE